MRGLKFRKEIIGLANYSIFWKQNGSCSHPRNLATVKMRGLPSRISHSHGTIDYGCFDFN